DGRGVALRACRDDLGLGLLVRLCAGGHGAQHPQRSQDVPGAADVAAAAAAATPPDAGGRAPAAATAEGPARALADQLVDDVGEADEEALGLLDAAQGLGLGG
ncbi:unnamed protein product, partial [Prorocentrum cordatum]